jgi:hypothetical protein
MHGLWLHNPDPQTTVEGVRQFTGVGFTRTILV